MQRNKTSFYYALYVSKKSIVDDYGNDTGEYEIKRSNPYKGFANISAANGETQIQQFGENAAYDKVIVIDTPLPIDEYSVLWIDSVPELNKDGSLKLSEKGEILTPHDYVVKKVAKSLNNMSIAISKVDVT